MAGIKVCLVLMLTIFGVGAQLYSSFSALKTYKLPDLPYDYGDLEPFLDKATLEVHHQGHHAAYTKKMNAALEQWKHKDSSVAKKSLVDILSNVSAIPKELSSQIINNAGGFVNHCLYWSVMSPHHGEEQRMPEEHLLDDIQHYFGSFDYFKDKFSIEAKSLFGSGYVWLVRNVSTGDPVMESPLAIVTTANQDTPLHQHGLPLLVLDVWEHAYYLKHRNLRPDYVDQWWNVVDWDKVVALQDMWSDRHSKLHDEL